MTIFDNDNEMMTMYDDSGDGGSGCGGASRSRVFVKNVYPYNLLTCLVFRGTCNNRHNHVIFLCVEYPLMTSETVTGPIHVVHSIFLALASPDELRCPAGSAAK